MFLPLVYNFDDVTNFNIRLNIVNYTILIITNLMIEIHKSLLQHAGHPLH